MTYCKVERLYSFASKKDVLALTYVGVHQHQSSNHGNDLRSGRQGAYHSEDCVDHSPKKEGASNVSLKKEKHWLEKHICRQFFFLGLVFGFTLKGCCFFPRRQNTN